MKQAKVYVGVDVAKAYLDVAWAKESIRLPNNDLGRGQLLKWLGQISGAVHVICEASGGYERAVVQTLQRSGIKVSVVQASRVRQFARASGIWAKTDRIDAALLAGFGEAIKPQASTAPEPEQDKLRELEGQPRHLSRLLVSEQNRSAQLMQTSLRGLSKRLISKIQKQIEQIDLLIKELIEGSAGLSAKAQKLTAVAGVGPRTAALLLAQMPELGELNRCAAGALAGHSSI